MYQVRLFLSWGHPKNWSNEIKTKVVRYASMMKIITPWHHRQKLIKSNPDQTHFSGQIQGFVSTVPPSGDPDRTDVRESESARFSLLLFGLKPGKITKRARTRRQSTGFVSLESTKVAIKSPLFFSRLFFAQKNWQC